MNRLRCKLPDRNHSAEFCAGWNAALNAICNSWIRTSERLPEEGIDFEIDEFAPEFLVLIEGAVEPTMLVFQDGEFWDEAMEQQYDVSYWMNFPLAPGMSYPFENEDSLDLPDDNWLDDILNQ